MGSLRATLPCRSILVLCEKFMTLCFPWSERNFSTLRISVCLYQFQSAPELSDFSQKGRAPIHYMRSGRLTILSGSSIDVLCENCDDTESQEGLPIDEERPGGYRVWLRCMIEQPVFRRFRNLQQTTCIAPNPKG